MHYTRILVTAVLIHGVVLCLNAQEARQTQLKAKWDQGLTLSAPEKSLSLRLGGRIHADFSVIDLSSKLEENLQDPGTYSTRFTRVRLYQVGQIGPNFSYKLAFDFNEGFASLKDVYLQLQQIPIVGNIRIGNQKEFFSIESMSSSNHTVFLDRGLGDRFMPRRNFGLTLSNYHFQGRLTWGGGLYMPTDETGSLRDQGSNDFNLTGRLVGVPYQKDEAHQLILSGAASYRSREQEQFEGTPETSIALDFMAPPTLTGLKHNITTNYTASLIHGPINLQAAYRAAQPAGNGTDLRLQGYYGQVSYFLTGENRNYNGAFADFKAITPDKNFNLETGGSGALELAFRYSQLDLNDGPYQGGQLTDMTAGVNWYLNPNTRFMVNYIIGDVKNGGDGRILQTRFQVNF